MIYVRSLPVGLVRLCQAFFKYMLAGGAGFLLDFSVLTLCYKWLGWHYLIAAALGFFAGLVFVYISSNRWVFDARKYQNHAFCEFLVFAIIGLIGLGLTVVLMWFFVECLSIYPLISKLVTTGLVLIWNFGARKVILYT